ncbi:MAG: PAS domain S-box protein [Deltaproteobacteria bacterium]|jgi:PAS domain S-box-containing protein|nr:PAS domain S-box protein [Deltaproteobacteria bacterium]
MDNKRLDELEAKLEIYKSTLTEIYDQYAQKLEELSLVRRVGDALRTTMTVESLASALMVTVAHEVVADRLALILKEDNGDKAVLRLRAAYWADREEFKFYPEGQGLLWSISSLGPGYHEISEVSITKPVTVIDAPPQSDPTAQESENPRNLLLAPFLVRNRFLGLLLLSRPQFQHFSSENEHMLSIMADQASAVLSNVQLFDELNLINTRLIDSEKRARETSDYLERLLETANDAILTLDSRGLVTYSNRKAEQWGWTKDELLGREFRQFLEDDPRLEQWAAHRPPPVDQFLEAILVTPAGERRTILISTSSVGLEDLGFSEQTFMLMVSDLTERRQLERQLLHSEKLASIGLLAAGVAHEVGNPLSAISGYAQILEAGVESDSERREYLTAILNQTGRIQKILRELLDYSRPSRGLSETLDLSDHLPKIMSMLESQRSISRIKIVYESGFDQPHLVTMDRDHLAQVVIIIAMNAAQAMAEQLEPEPTFTISLGGEAGVVSMTLSDNGPGMSPKVRQRVFDPFFTTKGAGQGTGLGLAICQRIVDSYHGRLELDTSEGVGSTFTVFWPEGRI